MNGEDVYPTVLLRLGPVELTSTVVYSLLTSALLIGLALAAKLGLQRRFSAGATVAELILEHLQGIMQDMSGADARPYTPLLMTLALFIGTANLMGLVPGLSAPTADFSTAAALAVVVFLAVPFYGVRARGLRGYLRRYLEPSPLMLPLEVIGELSRTLALAVRLFGNVMSEDLVIAVLLMIAGLLVPVPMMMLAVLTGVVQAYIFAILTMVYLSAAVRAHPE